MKIRTGNAIDTLHSYAADTTPTPTPDTTYDTTYAYADTTYDMIQ